jgi:hypothetical protein
MTGQERADSKPLHPLSAYCRPTRAKFDLEISVHQTVVFLTLEKWA